MKKYRKKPVVIEAIQIHKDNLQQLSDLPGVTCYVSYASITTLEGVMTGNIGDWIIRGVQGELYPCKDDIFQQTYEAVEETDERPRP